MPNRDYACLLLWGSRDVWFVRLSLTLALERTHFEVSPAGGILVKVDRVRSTCYSNMAREGFLKGSSVGCICIECDLFIQCLDGQLYLE